MTSAKIKILAVLTVFILFIPQIQAAINEGYGEDQTALGQFVDSFENMNGIAVNVTVERNTTRNAMELNFLGPSIFDSFEQYLDIWINSSRIDEVLIDFPILIILNGSAGINDFNSSHIFDEVGNSYQKIAITDNNFTDERYVEIEYWNATERIAWLWTHGTFSNISDTNLRLHYDGDVPNNTAFVDVAGSAVAQNVWNDGFIAVWHLSENNEPYRDSTQFNNDAYEIGTIARGEHQIDGGQNILGTNDGMTVDMDIGYDNLSVEAWVNWDALGSDRAIMSTWYVGDPAQGFLWFYDLVPGNRLRFIVDNGVADDSIIYGDNPPNLATWYYYAGVRTRNDRIYGYQNAVQTIGEVTPDTQIAFDNSDNLTLGIDQLARDLNAQLDELRISNVTRSPNWINATYFSETDDLITQLNGTLTGGYEDSGYFITIDYLSDPLANGSILVDMNNATIPSGTTITVQYSDDNLTWVNSAGIAGSNSLTDGFMSIDLRNLNYSTSYYKMTNFSTIDLLITPRLYQSRLITTEGNVSITSVIQNVTGEWIEYRASAINFTVGVHAGGDLNSTFDIDGDTWNHTEVVGVPGSVISINFTGVDPDAECVWVTIWYLYDGNLNHDFDIEMWNFTGSAWVDDGHIVDGIAFSWVNSTIYAMRIPLDFLSGGEVRVQLNHESPGNINHDLFIDYIRLIAKIPADVEAVEEFQFFWIVIAIALAMIILVLAKIWFEEGDP